MEHFKIKEELVNLLYIEDRLYTTNELRKTLKKKLKYVNKNDVFINDEIKIYLNEVTNIISIDDLITTIKLSYVENINKPNMNYFSYDQKPIY